MAKAKETERALPNSIEAERSVLGAVILLPSTYDDAGLTRDMFFDERHRRVWDCFQSLLADHVAVDLVTVVERLGQKSELEACGGHGYISHLLDGVPRISNVPHYARIVREKYALRGMIHAAQAMQERAFNQEGNAQELIDSATRAMVDLSVIAATEQEGITDRDAAVMLLTNLEKDDGPRAMTGVSELDEQTGGFISGEHVIVVAGTGTGKSIFCRQVKKVTCRQSRHSIYFSTEMLAAHLMAREVFPDAGVSTWKFRHPDKITPEDFKALVRAAAEECNVCRIFDGNLSLGSVRSSTRRFAKQQRLGLVVVDSGARISVPGKDRNEKDIALSHGLKDIAVENGCPVIEVSQLRKTLEPGKPPVLEDVIGSKEKIGTASWVIYIDRPYLRTLKNGTEADAKFFIMKGRDGQVGFINAKFDVGKLWYSDAPPTEADSTRERPERAKKERQTGGMLDD